MTRSLVLVSLPHACEVCGGARAVAQLDPATPGVLAPVSCPHCSAKVPIPIYVYPTRTDQPRGAA